MVITLGGVALAGATGCSAPLRADHVNSAHAPALDRPYSDLVRVGNMLYLSGALGTAPGTLTLVPGGVREQTRQALQNIGALLEENGSALDRVAKCTVMLADIADYAAMNEVYVEAFPGPKPARSTFAAQGLALGAQVEIECWALAGPREAGE